MLLHGPDEGPLGITCRAQQRSEIAGWAKDMEVKFVQTISGWKLL